MTLQGIIQGGVVVLQGGTSLPEGTKVAIIPCPDANANGSAENQPSIWDKLTRLAEWAESQPGDLPVDLAANHDHYLHGLPKRK